MIRGRGAFESCGHGKGSLLSCLLCCALGLRGGLLREEKIKNLECSQIEVSYDNA